MDHMQAFLVVQGLKASVQRSGRLVKADGINVSDLSEARQLADAVVDLGGKLKAALAEDVKGR